MALGSGLPARRHRTLPSRALGTGHDSTFLSAWHSLPQDEAGAAEDAGVVAEGGEEELGLLTEGLLADFVEEVVVDELPVIAGEAAGEDDGLGVIEVGEVGDADAEIARGAQDESASGAVAAHGALGDALRRGLPVEVGPGAGAV